MNEEFYYQVGNGEHAKVLTSVEDIILYIKSQLTQAEYLYGENLEGIDEMLYPDALNYKIECSEKLVGELLDVHFLRRDGSRIQASLAAQKFNRMLIDERKG